MSDIEIIEDVSSTSRKRNTYNLRSNSNKRKRTHSGLIETSEKMKGTETEFEVEMQYKQPENVYFMQGFVIDRTVTPQRRLTVTDLEKSEKVGSVSEWRKRLESTLLGAPPLPPNEKRSRKKECFNCGGEHNLYECTVRRDHRKIARRKEELAAKKQKQDILRAGGIGKQKLTKTFVPGVLSEELRSALGLRKHDIPTHVYRMRRMGFVNGYPPGWLRKAIHTKTIRIFSSEFDSEDEAGPEEAPQLDATKLIWYPGFNENDEKLNDLETFKIPPKEVFAQEHQKKLTETFTNRMNRVSKRKRKKLERKVAKTLKYHKFEDEDSDVIVVDTEGSAGKEMCKTPGEESSVVVLNENSLQVPEEKVAGSPAALVEMGESLFSTVGTPTFNRLHLTPVAPLDAFAVGIQPFEARLEDTPTASKGNFRKLMDSLKTIREMNISDPEIEKTEEKNKKKKRKEKKKKKTSSEIDVIQLESGDEEEITSSTEVTCREDNVIGKKKKKGKTVAKCLEDVVIKKKKSKKQKKARNKTAKKSEKADDS